MLRRFTPRKNVKAFTLAEVLITLGIIGVVAAMTIPALINNAKDRELKSAFKKRYSEISQAFTKMRTDNGGTLDGLFEGSNYATPNVMNPVILQYFKVVRNDWTANSAGNTVWHDPNTYYYMDNSKCTSTCGGCAGYILSDGSMMYTGSDNVNTCNSFSIPNLCMILNIDVNGFKKPNVMGRDIFILYVYKDKVVPPDALLPGSILDTNARLNNCAPAYLGGGCARQYLLE